MAAKRTKRTSARRSKPDWAPRFLAALAGTACIRRACAAAGVSRSNVYQRRDGDPEFAARMAEALEDASDDLEAEARRRAHDGVDEPVVYKGELMGYWVGADGKRIPDPPPAAVPEGARFVPLTVKRYSDALLQTLLRANRPEKFRENVRHEHTGRDGGPIGAKVTHEAGESIAQYGPAFAAFAQSVLAGVAGGAVPPDGALQPVDTPPAQPQAGAIPPAR